MDAQTLISVDEYLRTSYEHDPEFVHGEIVERGMPTYSHGDIQGLLYHLFYSYRKTHGLFASTEVRMRLSADLIRIPDVAVFAGIPAEVPTTPPLVAIEIASPDDRLVNTLEKFSEYRGWGVAHIWLVELKLRALFTYDGSLNHTNAFEIPDYGIRIGVGEIFS